MALTNSVSDLIPFIRSFIKDRARNDGQNVFEFDTDYSFSLSESFVDADSIIVYVNGTAISEDDWSFNSDTNKVTIAFESSGDDLNVDDIIIITFSYYKKYSDAEIEAYINSALGYFVQHQYGKTFIVDADSNILALNNIDPTENELYFICIITSILIDPQNISINTPEFSISANRQKSDQDQIKDAFVQFKNFIGDVDFDIIDTDEVD